MPLVGYRLTHEDEDVEAVTKAAAQRSVALHPWAGVVNPQHYGLAGKSPSWNTSVTMGVPLQVCWRSCNAPGGSDI
jgi:hypothetical protein